MTLPGYMEESNCTDGVNGIRPVSPTTCIQNDTAADFSLQAVAFEATLELISEVVPTNGLMVFADNYWATDPLMPQTAYPNIGSSFRNKPAESIVKAWFAR